jgi:acyl carrier protein
MTQKEVLDELKGIVVERLKFDPRRAAEMMLETTLPKGVEGSLGLDSLDFIELSLAIEEHFGIVIDEAHDGRVPLAGFPVPVHSGQDRWNAWQPSLRTVTWIPFSS